MDRGSTGAAGRDRRPDAFLGGPRHLLLWPVAAGGEGWDSALGGRQSRSREKVLDLGPKLLCWNMVLLLTSSWGLGLPVPQHPHLKIRCSEILTDS